LDLAKDAMWKVDPVGGTSYFATTESGQEVLFTPEEMLDTGPLLAELRAAFGARWFTIQEAERVTRIRTPFRVEHLRRRTLRPAGKRGEIVVERTGRAGFKEARLRFPRP
jgi:hypothetical protein